MGEIPFALTYRHAEYLIRQCETFCTTQMSFLNHPMATMYDKLHIYEGVCERRGVISIINNHDGTWSCDRTDRQLRYGNNLFRLWQGGEFGPGDALAVDGHRWEGR